MNAITLNASTLQAEDVEIKSPTKESQKSLKTVIVFNPSNMEAVLAAAIIKDRYPTAVVVDVAKMVPENGDQYLWLGVEPAPQSFSNKTVWKKDHIVAVRDKPVSQFLKTISGPRWKTIEANGAYHPNMCGKILDYLHIDAKRFTGLVDVVHRFNDPRLELSLLAFIYEGCQAALRSLSGAELFLPYPSAEQQARYLEAVKAAKLEMNGNVVIQHVRMEKVQTPVAVFCNVRDVWLVRRLVGFTYKHYVNSGMRLNGPSIEANFEAEKFANFSNVAVLS